MSNSWVQLGREVFVQAKKYMKQWTLKEKTKCKRELESGRIEQETGNTSLGVWKKSPTIGCIKKPNT